MVIHKTNQFPYDLQDIKWFGYDEKKKNPQKRTNNSPLVEHSEILELFWDRLAEWVEELDNVFLTGLAEM